MFVAATTTALALTPHHEAGLASGVVNTFHELGGAVGIAVLSTIAAASLTGSGVTGFTAAFLASAVAAGVAALVAAGLMPGGRLPASSTPHVH